MFNSSVTSRLSTPWWPNNPTGLMPDNNLLREIVARCRALNITLIVDEAFLDFLSERRGLVPSLAENSHLWVLR